MEEERALSERSLEELFAELEGTLDRMEGEECSLEESFALYERGMRLVRACNDKIDGVEKKLILLGEEARVD